MNKKPVLIRSIFAIVVIAIFSVSIYPLHQRDFYDTLKSILVNPNDPKVNDVIKQAKLLQEKDSGLYASSAIERACQDVGLDLKDFIKSPKGISDNRDVISLVRKESSSSIRPGLDLNGGVEFILKLIPIKKGEFKAGEKTPESDPSRNRDLAIEILRNRLESQNIFESEISPSGNDYISLKAPIVAKDEKLKLLELIKMSARLQFRLVSRDNESLVAKYQTDPKNFVGPVGYERMESTDIGKDNKLVRRIYFVQIKPEMTGENVTNAFQTQDEFGQRRIILEFNSNGASRFGEVTQANINRQLAIVLDDKLYCAPSIRTAIDGGRAEITGSFSREEAENIANALVSGSLPVKIEVEAVFDTDPTLGKENVTRGINAGVVSIVLVILFMLVYYFRAGLVADIALTVNVVLVLGALAAFEATLTLPGIAGIILTIGMAVDSNVLIYERIREELNSGKTLSNAIELGYSRAFSTIFDSNLTTLLTAVIMMWVGTGPIKGFAVTLTIGIVTSMFTALFLSRLIFDLMERFGNFKTLKMCHLLTKTNIDFMGMSKYCILGSVVLIAASLAIMGIRGQDSFGIDFTGGTQITIDYSKREAADSLTKTLLEAGYKNPKLTFKTSTTDNDKKLVILVREKDMPSMVGKNTSPKDEILSVLKKKYPEAGFSGGQETSVGGLIGWEFTKSAMVALLLSVIGILIYISIRFEFTFASAAVIALVHDITITTGIYLLLGMIFGGYEITLSVIAALLTILGYSINDTIVVFDRIREDNRLLEGMSFSNVINLSINQTLSRTMLTSLATLLVVVVMMVMGGVAIFDFVLVMFIGIIIGTYSSVFIASPIVAGWHRKIGNKA